MRYLVELRPGAARVLRKLPPIDRSRIARRIDALTLTPRPAGAKMLTGPERFYRIRVGDYRVIYQVSDEVLRVLVLRIGHRREIYR
jgi:mRNA interferase RelE/StbE